MIAAARAVAGGDDDKGGLSPGAMDMDVDGEYLASFSTGSTTIIEEESDSEEDSGGADSSCQPETAQVTMMGGNARPFGTRNGKRTLVAAVYLVLQDAAGESLRAKEIHARIQAKKLYVFRRRDGSVSTDDEKMRDCVRSACCKSPCFVRTEPGTYAIAKEYLNGSNTQDAVSTSPLRDAVYRVLQDAGRSLRVKEIRARIQAKKLYVFRRLNGSVSTDLKRMWSSVRSTCRHSPRFVRTARGIYAIAKEYLNRSTADNLNEQNSNATTNNNNTKTMSSPSPYALDLREALESGLMTEEEYAEAVQEAQCYDSKSPEKKKDIADYNEALRIIFADASLKLSDKEQCIVKREYLEEVGLCKAVPRPPSSKRTRTRSKTAPSIVKVKQEE
ncbi:hypothetical protein A3770_08p52650 [Chloropicon primus]|uniref:HTH HARE-type domain-containing protein n=1 Tax=Chloropicon primus TaxID=1764295 RepID=A0A5B8MQT5_9CHLO|nr:hypothetical protein A3770_08p52650 [Chloropicon primus]|eukprot:QDZ22747.1 hypothetical protein A3770_08p52650 [Chloropicon primus]